MLGPGWPADFDPADGSRNTELYGLIDEVDEDLLIGEDLGVALDESHVYGREGY